MIQVRLTCPWLHVVASPSHLELADIPLSWRFMGNAAKERESFRKPKTDCLGVRRLLRILDGI